MANVAKNLSALRAIMSETGLSTNNALLAGRQWNGSEVLSVYANRVRHYSTGRSDDSGENRKAKNSRSTTGKRVSYSMSPQTLLAMALENPPLLERNQATYYWKGTLVNIVPGMPAGAITVHHV